VLATLDETGWENLGCGEFGIAAVSKSGTQRSHLQGSSWSEVVLARTDFWRKDDQSVSDLQVGKRWC